MTRKTLSRQSVNVLHLLRPDYEWARLFERKAQFQQAYKTRTRILLTASNVSEGIKSSHSIKYSMNIYYLPVHC